VSCSPFAPVWPLSAQTGQVIVNTPAPGGFTSIRVNIAADNKSSAEDHPVAFDGKPYPTTGGDARKISYKRVDANTIERTQDRNGALTIDTEQVSKDGKTLTIKASTGNAAPRVFEKQFDVEPVGH
jgi:hypothetical protein